MSDDTRTDHLCDLFVRAASLDDDALGPFLDAHCDTPALREELSRLLAARHDAAVRFPSLGPFECAQHDTLPTLERYDLLRPLGKGGQARVYLAMQHETERLVAVKLLAPLGAETTRHLLQPEPVLQATTAHRNVAVIHEASVEDSAVPYIAMEYVEGPSIDVFCDGERLAIPARLRLFLDVCAGVTHAHRRGVLHRDIKPSNVLVSRSDGQPCPKLIDFGISRSVGSTSSSVSDPWVSGTPPYWSPEQAAGAYALTVASDVYSLGILLLELLTGPLPREGAVGQASDRLRQLAPQELAARASERGLENRARLIRQVTGDLDCIVLRATAHDPDLRYATVAALAQDINRHLARRAVSARPPSLAYGLSRTVASHRRAFLVAGAFVLTAVVATVSLLQEHRNALRATRAAQLAEASAAADSARAQAVTELLIDIFEEADPSATRGASITAAEVFETGATRVLQRLADQPSTQATLLDAIGQVYRSLALYGRAREIATEAVSVRRELEPDDAAYAESVRLLGLAEFGSGRYEDALASHREALALNEHLFGRESAAYAINLHNLGVTHLQLGSLEPALEVLEQALVLKRRHLPPAHDSLAETLTAVGSAHRRLGHYEEARAAFEDALVLRRALGQDIHRDTMLLLSNLGATANNLGDHATAEAYLRDALAMHEVIYGERNHHHVGAVLSNLGAALAAQDELDAAGGALRDAVGRLRGLLGAAHPDVAFVLLNLGSLELRQQQAGAARGHLAEALEILEQTKLQQVVHYCIVRASLAMALMDEGDLAGAEAHAQAGSTCARAQLPEGHRWVAIADSVLAGVWLRQGRAGEAVGTLQQAVAILEMISGTPGWRVQRAQADLGRARSESRDRQLGCAIDDP
ncbi:MAG: serine/threonine-protein kinase [Pseudomonadota bacterium]